MNSVNMVKNLLSKGNRVVLLPLYKSYADFFLLFYLNNILGFPSGFTFGCLEDTPKINMLDKWLKKCGFIFSKRAKD